MTKKPKKCTHPDCFTCPYPDCIFEQMTIDEYIESKQRDKDFAEKEPVMQYVAPAIIEPLPEYKQRSFDCTGRKEYFREYYQQNRERHLKVSREYREQTGYKNRRDRSEYYKDYYQKHREQKLQRAIERNKRIREGLNATG